MISEFSNKETTYVYYDDIKHETDKAVLFIVDGLEKWIPKSQLKDRDKEIFVIPTWLARKQGLK